MIDGILQGAQTAFSFYNILMVIIGCFAGTIIGMLPGLGPISAIALMIPITYGMDPSSGLILIAGVYYGAVFGGSTSSILINAPGVAGTVASSFDGYPLSKKGQAGKALAIAAYSSFSGGTIAAIFLLIAAPILANISLSFQSSDYFAMMLLGLTAVAAFSGRGNFLKASIMTIFGIMLSTIGIDSDSGIPRFTFGRLDLIDGISFLLLAMAAFALSEAMMNILENKRTNKDEETKLKNELGSLKLQKNEIRQIAPTIARSSILGFFVGILPGAGATIASFLAYGMERSFASKKEKQKFGNGSLQGLAGPESANNAASSGSFVPLLTLGIPGSGTTAVILGALISYGIQPGPTLYIDNPILFWSVIISMYIGNLVLLILNLPLIPYIAKILTLPKQLLLPLIIFFSLIGVYLVTFNNFDIYIMTLFAVVALFLRILDFPMAPMILGFILGKMIEDNLRRSLTISDGSISFLWERPITLSLLIIIIVIILSPIILKYLSKKRS
ncbi:tripartite tricarboxylate transporter TctA [Malaciobacter mytili LMG 24559]|uniref:Tripartite tricarboxylate transporter TctA n=1 Tax=Malaciobacter mytili LMG 24559 TaxID=1032238 RepID=A0AAX2AFW5_9BACT|nr:tripartite tricarboxylate transporter permease [Malaciobacter mytili]AXH13800.1 tripartite tricarboxylate transport protein TctABC, permease subunit TctA [Malaciobacter mytili LMG 24559]RXK15545.1 tripartite tricarboxylate transporter TctA [Malaciobacter mytili LMG 24559]